MILSQILVMRAIFKEKLGKNRVYEWVVGKYLFYGRLVHNVGGRLS